MTKVGVPQISVTVTNPDGIQVEKNDLEKTIVSRNTKRIIQKALEGERCYSKSKFRLRVLIRIVTLC